MADMDLDLCQKDIEVVVKHEDEGGVKKLKDRVTKRKGRGFLMDHPRVEGLSEVYDRISGRGNDEVVDISAQRSVEGWILLVTGIHEEAHEEDVEGAFAEHGDIKSLHLILDRRSGFLKGYALIEYEHWKDANAAKMALDGHDLLGNELKVEWAFMKKSLGRRRRY